MAPYRLLIAAALAATACTTHAGCPPGQQFDGSTGKRCPGSIPQKEAANSITVEDGHVYVHSKGVKQNMTDVMSAEKATVLLDEQDDALKRVERGAECGFKELVGSLIASNDKVQKTQDASLKVQKEVLASQDAYVDTFKNFSGDLLAGMKALQQATEGGSTTAPATRLVTQCEGADQICVTTAPGKVNVIVAGTVYEDVAGIYTCDFVNDKKAVATTAAIARSAGPPGAAIITCHSPAVTSKFVTGKTFKTTLVVKFGGEPFKYAGKTGGNTVSFKTVGPRVTSVPGSVDAKAGKTKGKFTFTFTVVDGDTEAKDLKVTVKSSLGNAKALPDSAIKVSRSDFTFTVVVQPDMDAAKKLSSKSFELRIDVADNLGNKMEKTVVVKGGFKIQELLMKLCTSDGRKRTWGDGGWWDNSNTVSAGSDGATHRGDIKTSEYSNPMGTGIVITAWESKTAKKIGSAFYKVKSQFRGTSLRDLMRGTRGNNVHFADRDNSISSKDRTMHGKNGHPYGKPDLFLDRQEGLQARSHNKYGAHDNRMRLATTYNGGGGHRLGGLGGTHYHGSWQADFEAAPWTPYCNPNIRYGTDTRHTHRSHYVYSSCGGFRTNYIDFTIDRYFP